VKRCELIRVSPNRKTLRKANGFDVDDLMVLTRELRAARDRVQPWERFAVNRLIDLLEK
jgi:hypothetical protein